jgi:hypothetical protein
MKKEKEATQLQEATKTETTKQEKVFEVKEGTHIVFKKDDVLNYVGSNEMLRLMRVRDQINTGRAKDGKEANDYYVVNKDEPYSEEVLDIIKKGELGKSDES